jgi:hypothetical protein
MTIESQRSGAWLGGIWRHGKFDLTGYINARQALM